MARRHRRHGQQRPSRWSLHESSGVSLETSHNYTIDSWKRHSDLNPLHDFATWIVPSKHVQSVLREPRFQPFLASTTTIYNGRKKIRLVQSYNTTHQLILLKSTDDIASNVANDLVESLDISHGPTHTVQLDVSYFSVTEILQVLNIPPITAYEQVGHVVHLNLRNQHQPFRTLIGHVFLSTLPNVHTVVQKIGEVRGSHRIYDMELLAGTNDTNVTVVENGVSLSFNLRNVYWNSRLAGERQYLLQHEFQDNQTIVDVFSGVGMLCLLVATKRPNCQVYANDVNPHAIRALQRAAAAATAAGKQRRRLQHDDMSQQIHTSCGDAYEFLVDMGLEWDTLPHHVIMNYPNDAVSFLSALRWWRVPKKKNSILPTMHVYTFVHRCDGTAAAAAADSMQSAIDLVAHNLLPEGNEPTPNRTLYLNKLGCDVRAREIRDVAPGKVVVCVTFKATAQLLRHMQGDYV